MAWRLWAKALGAKEGSNDKEANYVACIRTVIFATYFITNCAIVANAVRHWNDNHETEKNYERIYRQERQHLDMGRDRRDYRSIKEIA
jgi:hypothetical protein